MDRHLDRSALGFAGSNWAVTSAQDFPRGSRGCWQKSVPYRCRDWGPLFWLVVIGAALSDRGAHSFHHMAPHHLVANLFKASSRTSLFSSPWWGYASLQHIPTCTQGEGTPGGGDSSGNTMVSSQQGKGSYEDQWKHIIELEMNRGNL